MRALGRLLIALLISLPVVGRAQESTTPPPQDKVNDRAILAGDIVTGLMPVLAFGKAWLGENDNRGMKQWMWSTAIDEVVLTAARVGFNETSWGKRPNGNAYGFPSGHAGFLYSQTAFLQYRYGWTWGVPSFVVATGVNYIRVRYHKHRWRDIIAAGGLSYALSWPVVSRYDGGVVITPVVEPGAWGVQVEKTFGDPK
ncbi:MAG TPA: hypothetical protein VFB36_17015 [Nevskiaceae bacterium]|nr:hypothetical protein [Nevskiaceae bacterium]